MLNSTSDILKDVLEKSGEVPSNKSKFYQKAIDLINTVYLAILSGSNEFDVDLGEAWPWAMASSPKILNLLPPYEVGTVTCTLDSTTGTLSNPPAYSLTGWILKITDSPDYYKITAHTAGSPTVALESGFTEDTGSYDFMAIKLEYTLGDDVLRLANPINVYRNQVSSGGDGKIYLTDMNSMRREWPLIYLEQGTPERFAESFQDGDNLKLYFNKYVSEKTKIDIEYIPIPETLSDTTSSVPKLPLNFREALVFGATYYLLTQKNDKQAPDYFTLTQRKLKALLEDKNKKSERMNRNRARLLPRQEQVSRSSVLYE